MPLEAGIKDSEDARILSGFGLAQEQKPPVASAAPRGRDFYLKSAPREAS
jgi:hypothetical protein